MGSSAAPVSRSWSISQLENFRQIGDPLADGVIAELFADNDIGAVNALMRNMISNEYPEPESLPSVVRDYLAQTDTLPEWADPTLIEAGERVFWCYGPQMILNLNCYGLPFCYLGKNGVHVLALTTRLLSNATRRVVETGQMLVDVMQPGGLTRPNGRGRRTIQKVRLMHAAVRKLAPTSLSWKPESGVPVNQEDLAGTLMAFSWIALDGLQKLGYKLSPEERTAYLHSWLVVGHLLGIRDDILPANPDAAAELVRAIADHQFGPSEEGQALNAALINMLADILPGHLLKHAAPLLMRFFLGAQWAEWLGIKEGELMDVASAPLRLLGLEASRILEDCAAARRLFEHLSQLLINSFILVERGGNRPSFAIPADLREQWGVNWTP